MRKPMPKVTSESMSETNSLSLGNIAWAMAEA